jgi:hypothetical protein
LIKNQNDIREELKYALRHSREFDLIRMMEGNSRSGKPGPTIPLGPRGSKIVLYMSLWNAHKFGLPTHERVAIELYYIQGMDRAGVAEELECVPDSVSDYCGKALTWISDEIWRSRANRRCEHCGAASVVAQQTPATAWEPEQKCLLCNKVQ